MMNRQTKTTSWVQSVVLLAGLVLTTLPALTACAALSESGQTDRAKIAKAKFEEHCKSAGEKIYRTVDNVEGIFVMKLRPETRNFGNQFVMDDPYGDDVGGEGFLETFLRGSSTPTLNPQPGWPKRLGYLYVEVVDTKNGQRYRYTGRRIEPWQDNKTYLKGYTKFVMNREIAKGDRPRYGVTFDDISTHEDREYWIAGSLLKVVDLQTNEVIAERIGYMWDPEQGNTNGGRSPWMVAADHACPDFHRYSNSSIRSPGFSNQARQAADFSEKILIPKMDN